MVLPTEICLLHQEGEGEQRVRLWMVEKKIDQGLGEAMVEEEEEERRGGNRNPQEPAPTTARWGC